MVDIDRFISTLAENGVTFFTGVPDSNLNDFCRRIAETVPADRHIIAANEGNAIAIAAGYYMGCDCIPLVYMQNSGMGNALNPLVSLCDEYVYSIPAVLLIGWRGDPSINDHAQHRRQGELTTVLLDDMKIPYMIIDEDNAIEGAGWAAREARRGSRPAALVVKKGVLTAQNKIPYADGGYPLSREEAINVILDAAPGSAVYSATTGRASRELYELRNIRGEDHAHDFLNVGSMGHASSVAFGMALACPERPVICLDGDAAAIMHMGSLAVEGKSAPANYLRVVLNNGVHESVGGQPSAGRSADLTGAAAASGFDTVAYEVMDADSLTRAVRELLKTDRPGFIDMKIHAGLRPDMPVLRYDHHETIDALKAELR